MAESTAGKSLSRTIARLRATSSENTLSCTIARLRETLDRRRHVDGGGAGAVYDQGVPSTPQCPGPPPLSGRLRLEIAHRLDACLQRLRDVAHASAHDDEWEATFPDAPPLPTSASDNEVIDAASARHASIDAAASLARHAVKDLLHRPGAENIASAARSRYQAAEACARALDSHESGGIAREGALLHLVDSACLEAIGAAETGRDAADAARELFTQDVLAALSQCTVASAAAGVMQARADLAPCPGSAAEVVGSLVRIAALLEGAMRGGARDVAAEGRKVAAAARIVTAATERARALQLSEQSDPSARAEGARRTRAAATSAREGVLCLCASAVHAHDAREAVHDLQREATLTRYHADWDAAQSRVNAALVAAEASPPEQRAAAQALDAQYEMLETTLFSLMAARTALARARADAHMRHGAQ
jgi:hypothetical protein